MKKIAVIGLGNISHRHRRNLRQLYPNATILAMSSSGTANYTGHENIDIFVASIDELISHKPSFVLVASPASHHAYFALPLIRANIPVLIEKPLAACASDSEAIIIAASQAKTPVAVGYCLRYLSSALAIDKLLQKSVVGIIYNIFIEVGQYLPDWRPSKNYKETVSASTALGGGALLELSHELDYVQWLFGKLTPISSVLRSSNELALEVEDSADVLCYTTDRAVVTMHLDFLQHSVTRRCKVIGSEGNLEWNLIKNEIVLLNAAGEQVLFSEPNWDKNQMYLNMLLDFEQLIKGEINQCISLNEASQTVGLVETIKKMAGRDNS